LFFIFAVRTSFWIMLVLYVCCEDSY
jgi:hypothetical protein